jgi:hypothetical protein
MRSEGPRPAPGGINGDINGGINGDYPMMGGYAQ